MIRPVTVVCPGRQVRSLRHGRDLRLVAGPGPLVWRILRRHHHQDWHEPAFLTAPYLSGRDSRKSGRWGDGEKSGLFLVGLTPVTWFFLLVGAVFHGEKTDLSQVTDRNLLCRARKPEFKFAAARSGPGDWRGSWRRFPGTGIRSRTSPRSS